MTRKSAYKYLNQVYFSTKNDSYREALSLALSALRPITKEQVEKVWGSEWELVRRMAASFECKCPKCQRIAIFAGRPANFCEKCGSANTDEAVQIVMQRLEAIR